MSIYDIFLRSSFGLSRIATKMSVKQYARDLCADLPCAGDIELGWMPKDKDGANVCKCDDYGQMTEYFILLNDTQLNSARGRDALDKAFTRAMVSAGHEVAHLLQIDSRDPEMRLSYLAESGNDTNYIANYLFNRREIAAETLGLKFLQAYFESQYPSVDGDRFLLDYVNDHLYEGRPYWIGIPDNGFSSMDDVFGAFDDAYDAAALHVNTYRYKPAKTCQDAFVVLTGVGSGKGLSKDWMFMYDAMQDADDAYESNKILAAAALYLNPGLAKYAVGVDLPDLSIKAVFGRDAPDILVVPDVVTSEPEPVRSPKITELFRRAGCEKTCEPDDEIEPTK